jgi:hypothetical protein
MDWQLEKFTMESLEKEKNMVKASISPQTYKSNTKASGWTTREMGADS